MNTASRLLRKIHTTSLDISFKTCSREAKVIVHYFLSYLCFYLSCVILILRNDIHKTILRVFSPNCSPNILSTKLYETKFHVSGFNFSTPRMNTFQSCKFQVYICIYLRFRFSICVYIICL